MVVNIDEQPIEVEIPTVEFENFEENEPEWYNNENEMCSESEGEEPINQKEAFNKIMNTLQLMNYQIRTRSHQTVSV